MAAVAHRVGGDAGDALERGHCPSKARRSRFANASIDSSSPPGRCFVRSKAESPAHDRWRRAERSVQARPGRASITISRAGSRRAFRTTSEVGRRGGEVAAGMRIQPVGGIPVWFTAERRQRLGKYGGGRNAFAMFVEGGVYNRPMPWQFSLDAYLEGGVVGFHHRDRFIDGGLTLTRPVYRQFSAGLGVWGGAQPGVYRVDAGPRISMRVRNNVRVHLDWRQRLAGNAAPGSGPAVTLAGDF